MKSEARNTVLKEIRQVAFGIQLRQGISLLFAFLTSVIVARQLGPNQKGIVDAYVLFGGILVDFGLLGMGGGLFYYLTKHRAPLKKIHGISLGFSFLQGIVTILFGLLLFSILGQLFPNLPPWMLILSLILSPIMYYLGLWHNLMIGISKGSTLFTIELAANLLRFIGVGSLVVLAMLQPDTMVLLLALTTFITAVLGFLFLRSVEPTLRWDAGVFRGSLKYGLSMYAGVLANAMHFKIDQIMVNYWLGSAALGNLTIAVRLAEMLFLLDVAISSAALSKISAGAPADGFQLAYKLTGLQLLLTGSVGVLVGVSAEFIILNLYGDAFSDAVLPLIYLIPGILFWSASKYLAGWLTFNQGRAKFLAKVSIVGALMNILLNYIAIKHIQAGLAGVAAASTITYAGVALAVFMKANAVKKHMV